MSVVFCMISAGGSVSPSFVFSNQNKEAELLDEALPWSIVACHPSG